jgi:hypothetical protein
MTNKVLDDAERRIKRCLQDCQKRKEAGMPEGYHWQSEALGYKTALECIKRAKEADEKLEFMRHSVRAPYISDEAHDWLIDELHKPEPSSPSEKKVTR